jgi:hypothetical protein
MVRDTGWFAVLLKATRDSLIVHSRPFPVTAMISSKGGVPRPLTIDWDSSTVNRYFPRIKDIRSHYPDHRPLQEENNFWSIIEILSNIPLTKDDEVELTRIIGSVGTTLPRLETICSGFIAYTQSLSIAALG